MTQVKCHYRLAGFPTHEVLAMTTTNINPKTFMASATLPAFPKDAEGPAEYYFDFKFGRVCNRQGSPEGPLEVPLQ
jgi:hypothetical protein